MRGGYEEDHGQAGGEGGNDSCARREHTWRGRWRDDPRLPTAGGLRRGDRLAEQSLANRRRMLAGLRSDKDRLVLLLLIQGGVAAAFGRDPRGSSMRAVVIASSHVVSADGSRGIARSSSTDQNRIVPSAFADTTKRPSGENATRWTRSSSACHTVT